MDFGADDPIEIIKHLMIGSEGTLGFVSQVRGGAREGARVDGRVAVRAPRTVAARRRAHTGR